MGSDFIFTTIGEQLTLQRGFDITRKEQNQGLVPVVSSGGISSFHDTAKVLAPGVVLGRKGSLGTVYFLDEDYWPHDTTLWVKDFKGNNPHFIYYFFKGIADELKKMDVGAANPALNRNHVHLLKVKWPCRKLQDQIVSIAASLDQKITLNCQINQTLEQMAQTLFKSWFVDFDPVIDNALDAGNPIPDELQHRAEQRKAVRESEAKPQPDDIRQLFPNAFEESELGWVPEGWGHSPLEDIAPLRNKSIAPNKESEKVWEHYSIPAFDKSAQPTLDIGESIKSSKYIVPNSSILVSKLNPSTKRVWMPKIIDESSAICSTEFMPFVPVIEATRPFLYCLLASDYVQKEICSRVTGTTGSRQRVKPKEISMMELLLPDSNLMKAFSAHIEPHLGKVQETLLENRALENLRDTLLPKLISGELRLDQLDMASIDEVALSTETETA